VVAERQAWASTTPWACRRLATSGAWSRSARQAQATPSVGARRGGRSVERWGGGVSVAELERAEPVRGGHPRRATDPRGVRRQARLPRRGGRRPATRRGRPAGSRPARGARGIAGAAGPPAPPTGSSPPTRTGVASGWRSSAACRCRPRCNSTPTSRGWRRCRSATPTTTPPPRCRPGRTWVAARCRSPSPPAATTSPSSRRI